MPEEDKNAQQSDPMAGLPYDFIQALMDSLDDSLTTDKAADIVRQCHCAHYELLNMDSITEQYTGNLEGFIELMENKWGWQVDYNQENGIIEIDENKPFCVCPLVQDGKIDNSLLCYCSEGFAKKMFSAVLGRTVAAKVEKSVLRGDGSCVYRIDMSQG